VFAPTASPGADPQASKATTPFDADQRRGAAGGDAPAEQTLQNPFPNVAAAAAFADGTLQRVIAGPASEAVSTLANHREPQHVLNLFR
jgi:hypothetical protein